MRGMWVCVCSACVCTHVWVHISGCALLWNVQWGRWSGRRVSILISTFKMPGESHLQHVNPNHFQCQKIEVRTVGWKVVAWLTSDVFPSVRSFSLSLMSPQPISGWPLTRAPKSWRTSCQYMGSSSACSTRWDLKSLGSYFQGYLAIASLGFQVANTKGPNGMTSWETPPTNGLKWWTLWQWEQRYASLWHWPVNVILW